MLSILYFLLPVWCFAFSSKATKNPKEISNKSINQGWAYKSCKFN